MTTIKACVHCINLRSDENGKLVCGLEIALDKLDLVRGFRPQLSAYAMRANKAACGPEGKLFQEIAQPMRDELEAVRMAYGAGVAMKARSAALATLAFPGNVCAGAGRSVARGYFGAKASLGRFAARCGAAVAAFRGITDNTVAPPVLLTADPVEEAQAVNAGDGPVINQEVMIDAVSDANVAALEKAIREAHTEPAVSDASVSQEDVDRLAPGSVPVADPKQEATAAHLMALAVTVVLAGYLCAGLLSYASQQPGTLSSLFKLSQTCCTKGKPGDPTRCYPCPDGRSHEASAVRWLH